MLNNVTVLLLSVPFLVILWLANMADRSRLRGRRGTGLAALGYVILVIYYMVLLLAGLLFLALATIVPGSVSSSSQQLMQGIASPGLVALGLTLPPLFGMLLLLRPLRRLLACLIDIDPASTTHAVALAYTMLIPINFLALLGIGLENAAAGVGEASSTGDSQMLISLWSQELLFFATGVVGVGLLSRRGWRAVAGRLGLMVPGLRQAALGLGAGIVLAALSQAIVASITGLGFPVDEGVQRLNEQIYGPWSRTVPGILTIGLSAALGEETLFRGALQPRFGLAPTAVLFALVHSNYGLSLVTLIVLVVGIALGLIRQRYNTSTSMVAHAAYNIAQPLLELLP
ncbi:MAG: CPBP family intramembrane metalloprotease [Chloroflexi bacterium]|nr:CPBP family intramembrane metalloprotease [Chloroflexota bacterium]MCL5026151.1 CPBP family intramembrane metalloprotease [Chloroflexota bacterium]